MRKTNRAGNALLILIAVFFGSSGNSGKSVRYTLSPPSQSAAFKVVPASPVASKMANLGRRRLG
jgi:hypothetical protein